ncbi:cell division protein ZapB [Neoaquamicrobium sediminum]|uniref:cell division protein ZapB n=1 Tax=Neoaquamicrobium sediminum TaxID=1849104 RepID=UPI0015643AE2|nr:cell division protein ZapB [Mesorhizobium sediminum]NRC55063.1 hypothetical protein [Mesorhizobium sediminum]
MARTTKKTTPSSVETREELLAKLEALDTNAEIARLKDEVKRLEAQVADLIAQRKQLSDDNAQWVRDFEAIARVVRPIDNRRTVRITYGAPVTASPSPTPGAVPARNLAAGAPKVSQGELGKFFPELSGPSVPVTADDAPTFNDDVGGETVAASDKATAE